MAKINKQTIYVPDQTVRREDNWVGTDYQDFNKTKTFFVGNILDYIMLNYAGTEQNNFVTEKTLGVIDTSVEDAFIDALNALEAYTVAANEIIMYTGDILGETFNTKFVYVLKSGKGEYGVGGTGLALTDILLLNPVQEEVERTTTIVNNLISEGDKILYGNIVHETGLTFKSTNVGFVISGQQKYEDGKLITLDTPDEGEVNSRTDVFVLDVRTSGIQVLKGIPAASPQEPALESPYQLRFSAVRINPAGVPEVVPNPGDTPTTIVTESIYDDNLGEPSEWAVALLDNAVSGNSGWAVFIDNDPVLQFNSVFTPSRAIVELTTVSPIAYNAESVLSFDLWNTDFFTQAFQFLITISDGSVTSTKLFNSQSIISYGGGSIPESIWQLIAIPLGDFIDAPTTINSVEFMIYNNPIVFVDRIKIQSQIAVTPSVFVPTKTSELINDGHDGISPYKMKIGGYWVDKNGNTNFEALEVGDSFDGWVSATRYVVGRVIGLPFDVNDETKVRLVIDNM
jgi:hypothetical protein